MWKIFDQTAKTYAHFEPFLNYFEKQLNYNFFIYKYVMNGNDCNKTCLSTAQPLVNVTPCFWKIGDATVHFSRLLTIQSDF